MVVPVHSEVPSVDVLIVGAGPAGLMAANALARAGISVRVVDKRFNKVEAGQADGIQPRTMEVFQSYGLVDRLIEKGCQVIYSAFYDPTPDGGIARSGRACRVSKNKSDIDLSGSRYTYSITLNQGAIEDIFLDSMRQQGVTVERPVQPCALLLSEDESVLEGADSYPVKVVLHKLDCPTGEIETEVVRARYMLGSDGAHSWVRKQLGITMDGEQTNYVWGVVDSQPTTDFPDIRNRCLIHSLGGSMMVIPREGDLVRLYSQLSDEDAQEVLNANGRIDTTKWGPERLFELCKAQLHPYTISFPKEMPWWTLYIIGQRVASAYSKNERVFIAGDACHTHSPKAGQGMNASMNDTHNLAWKLAYVLRGWASRSLLQTYEFERRKYAQDLIDFDRKWSKLFSGKPRTEQNKDGVTHEEMLKVFETFSVFSSGAGIQYAPSPITNIKFQNLVSNLKIGMRMPPQIIVRAADARAFELQDLLPSDTRFKVFVFAGDLTVESQMNRLKDFIDESTGPSGFLMRFGRRTETSTGWDDVFDVFTILIGKKETIEYTCVPAALRPHWSKVFVDDETIAGTEGGKAYRSFGISDEGAVIVVRPDGYVGMVAPLDGAESLNDYFAAFMKSGRVA